MIATDAIRDNKMTTAMDATSDTVMPEGAVTLPMMTTPSRTNGGGATTGAATRAADIISGEKTPTGTTTVAPETKETAIAVAETAGLPRGGIRNSCW